MKVKSSESVEVNKTLNIKHRHIQILILMGKSVEGWIEMLVCFDKQSSVAAFIQKKESKESNANRGNISNMPNNSSVSENVKESTRNPTNSLLPNTNNNNPEFLPFQTIPFFCSSLFSIIGKLSVRFLADMLFLVRDLILLQLLLRPMAFIECLIILWIIILSFSLSLRVRLLNKSWMMI